MLKKNIFFSDLIYNQNIEFNNFGKQKIRKLPKVGKIYLVRYGINSLLSKNSAFISKNFLGRCMFFKRKNSTTALFYLRNIYNRYPIELRFFLKSPLIFKIFEIKRDQKKFRRNKLSYFKHLSVFKSRV